MSAQRIDLSKCQWWLYPLGARPTDIPLELWSAPELDKEEASTV